MMDDPGAVGLADLDRMSSARPRATDGTLRFCLSWRLVARDSRDVDIGRRTGSGRNERKDQVMPEKTTIHKNMYFTRFT